MAGRRGLTAGRAPALALLTLAVAFAGCGGGGGDGGGTPPTSTNTPPATTTEARQDEPSPLGVGEAKGAAGTVTLCGDDADVVGAAPAIGRFNRDRPRLQASTLGFPPRPGRTARELRSRIAAGSKECDLAVLGQDDVAALAAEGGLYDLQPYAEERGETGAVDVVRSGLDVVAVRAAFGLRPRSVLAVLATAGNPGGALALLDALSDGNAVPPEKP